MTLKAVLVVLLLAVSVFADENEKPIEICSKCKCSTKTKVIDCTNKDLSRDFKEADWTALDENNGSNYETLILANNQLTTLPVPMPVLKSIALKKIDLSHNKITDICKGYFKNLNNLTELNLSFNDLTTKTLRPNIFEGKYDPDEFEPLRSVRSLNLANNQLHSLHPDIFEHLQELEYLSLASNQFQFFTEAVVHALGSIMKIVEIDLSYMELDDLPEHVFHNIHSLQKLVLKGNLLKSIPKALKWAVNLKELNLDENPLADLNESNKFPVMENLQILNMSFIGPLTVIGKGSMSGLMKLKQLHLSDNHQLAYIHPDAFVKFDVDNPRALQWPPLVKLQLQNNNLTILDANMLSRWDDIEELGLYNNPWNCVCENQWMVDTVLVKIQDTNPTHIEQIKCAKPKQLEDKLLIDLLAHHKHLRCADKNGNDPSSDGSLLIALLVGLLLSIPITFISLVIYKRGCFGLIRPGPGDYSRAFYKRANQNEQVHI